MLAALLLLLSSPLPLVVVLVVGCQPVCPSCAVAGPGGLHAGRPGGWEAAYCDGSHDCAPCLPLSPCVQSKNEEVERAVDDMIALIRSYPLDPDLFRIDDEDVQMLKSHYNHFMYQVPDGKGGSGGGCVGWR